MHRPGGEASRLFESIVRAARGNWWGRRIHYRARNVGQAAASRMTGIWAGLIEALHDSRSRLAARVIDQHRHLLQDDYRAGDPRWADDARLVTQPAYPTEQ